MSSNFWHGKQSNLFDNGARDKKYWTILLVVAVLVFAIYFGFWLATMQPNEIEVPYITGDDVGYSYSDEIVKDDDVVDLFEDGDTRVVMIVGADEREGDVGRSDTLILAFLHKESKQVELVSIPRDTYVTLANTSQEETKINHAYAYGGIELLEATVENFLGIEVNNYVEVNFDAFVEIIDAIGGVEIDVEFDMYNESESIDISAGLQVLDGNDALGYVRYREDVYGDIGRVARQQYFLEQLAVSMLDLGNIVKIPTIISIVMDNLDTDLSSVEILSLVATYSSSLSSDLTTVTLPGVADYIDGVSYWIVDEDSVDTLISKYLY